MRWMVVRWIGAMGLVLAACSDSERSDASGEGGGEGESAGEAGESAGESAGQTESGETAGETSGTEEGGSGVTTVGDPLCDDNPSAGGECSIPGQVCAYGDDCGSWTYECQSGAWVQIDGSGCGADPIACEDSPVDGDPCNFDEPCDPDGDCMDVLECDSYNWKLYAVCSEQYCEAAAPQSGKPCDEPARSCSIETECGARSFFCAGTYWDFTGGDICEIPQPCTAGPVPNDACDMPGAVCVPPVEDLPTLECDGTTWQPQ